jgi:hypothetical protein
VIYFCKDYLKFGKTNYQGGFYRYISIEAGKETNLKFTFWALPVKGGTDNYDDVILHVVIEGPGSVGTDDRATKTGIVDISKIETGTLPYEWREERDKQTVILYGVTAESKIIIKTDREAQNPGSGSWYFRYYIDNLKFEKYGAGE